MLCGLQEDMCLLMHFYRLFEGRCDNLNTKKIKKIKVNVDEIAGNFMTYKLPENKPKSNIV